MTNKNYIIRKETPADFRETENVVRRAFWNVYRPGCLEHFVLHTYRNQKDFVPELDFVLLVDGQIIGQIMFVKAEITKDDGTTVPIMTFGPIGIIPEFKRQGYGKILLDYALEKAKNMGVGAVCMEGNIDFYGKSGFVVASSKNIHYFAEPKEEVVPYFLVKELIPHFLDGVEGVYHTPQGYFVDEKSAEEFDETFPKMEKLKLEGQLF